MKRSKNQTVKLSKKKLLNKTISFTSYIFSTHTLIPLGLFFIHFADFFPLVSIGKGYYSFYVPFLANWYERITKVRKEKVSDLRYAVKFENRVKNKNNFFMKQNIFFKNHFFFFLILGKVFFMSPKNSIDSAFFLPKQILKNINMPRHLPTAQANSEGCSACRIWFYIEPTSWLYWLKKC